MTFPCRSVRFITAGRRAAAGPVGTPDNHAQSVDNSVDSSARHGDNIRTRSGLHNADQLCPLVSPGCPRRRHASPPAATGSRPHHPHRLLLVLDLSLEEILQTTGLGMNRNVWFGTGSGIGHRGGPWTAARGADRPAAPGPGDGSSDRWSYGGRPCLRRCADTAIRPPIACPTADRQVPPRQLAPSPRRLGLDPWRSR